MFDILEEKSKTLSKLGSFYYSTITNKDVNLAHRLSHVAYNTGLFHLFRNIYNNVSNLQYTDLINKVITFLDSDIKFGTFEIGNKSANYIPDTDQITLLPDELLGSVNKLHLDDDVSLAYVLTVPKNIYVKIIRLDDGTTLFNGLNFKSKYGLIVLRTNPIHLFKGMQFFVLSYLLRDRNILCYPLGVLDVYGSVNHITDYYRNNQSLSAFKKALYQAIGVPVVEDYCTIISIVKLNSGVSYITSSGVCYDADFPHLQFQVGDNLNKDTIIGGEEFLKVYLPGDTLPADIEALNILSMSIPGGKSLYVYNRDADLYIDNVFLPQNFVKGEGALYYTDYVNKVGSLSKVSESIPDRMNCIDFLRNVVAANRCIILLVDKEKIPYDISMKLKSFIIDHAPIGSVIAYCDGELPLPELIRLRTNIDISAPADRLQYLDDGTTPISSLNLTSDKGFTLMLTMNWTSVTEAPLIWFAHDLVDYTVGNAMAVLGYTKGFKHNSMFSALSNNTYTTDLYPITDDNKDNVPDYIDSTSPSNNTSLAGKTLVYFITIKEKEGKGRAVLYELMNDKTVKAIAECYNASTNVLSRGTLGWITCSNWVLGSVNAGFVTVDAYDGILTQEEMNRLANNISL